MKNIFKFMVPFMALALTLVSCEDTMDDKSSIDNQFAKATNATVSLGSLVAVDYQTIKATGSVANPSSVIEEGIQLSTDANFATAILSIPNDTIAESFEITYSGANYETDYYVRAYAVTKTAGTIVTAAQMVTTPTPPLIITWKKLGKATYREDCFTTFWNVDNLVYSLDLYECEQIPGWYHLMNPYGAAYGYNEDGDFDTSKDYYLDIHAEDPTAVYIGNSPTGCDWTYGEISIYSLAGMYIDSGEKTLEECKAAGLTGTLVDGVLTFPAKTLLIGMSEFLIHYGWTLAIAAVVFFVWFRKWKDTPAGRAKIDGWKLKAPLIKGIVAAGAYSSLAYTLKTLLSNGVNVLQALKISEETCNNAVIAEALAGHFGQLYCFAAARVVGRIPSHDDRHARGRRAGRRHGLFP